MPCASPPRCTKRAHASPLTAEPCQRPGSCSHHINSPTFTQKTLLYQKIPPYKSAMKSCSGRCACRTAGRAGPAASAQRPGRSQKSQPPSPNTSLALRGRSSSEGALPHQDAGMEEMCCGQQEPLPPANDGQMPQGAGQQHQVPISIPGPATGRTRSRLSRVTSRCSAGEGPALEHFLPRCHILTPFKNSVCGIKHCELTRN